MNKHLSKTISFLEKNNIKWMPVVLKNKIPVNINHEAYYRKNKKDKPTFTPNFIEFPTITDEILKERQDLFLNNEIMNYVDDKDVKIRLAIDTYNVFQIDIDSPDVDASFVCEMTMGLNKTAYYKSLTKSYGKHIFIKLSNVGDFREYIKDKTTSTATSVYQIKNNFTNEYNEVVDIFKTGVVELLTGKWGYLDIDTKIINTDILEISNESIISILNVKEKVNEPITDQENKIEPITDQENNNKPIKNVFDKHRYLDDEIRDHMNNIDIKYIDVYADHFKLICSLLNGGYYEIARECMFRSSNTKNKDLNHEFDNFKKGNNGSININTIFYYSKKSNEKDFNRLLRKHRGLCLKPCDKKHLINLNYITENINERYLPYSIMKNIDMSSQSILHLKSHLGTGKTTIIKQFLRENPNLRVLYFAPRILFARDIYNDLKDVGFEIYNKIEKGSTPAKVIPQLESCYRFLDGDYDVIILDEVESVLKQITSVFTNKSMFNTYSTFDKLIRDAQLVITADAFLTNNSIDTINNIKNGVRSSVIVNNNIPYERNAFEVAGYDALLEKAIDQVKRNERIVFITLTKNKGDDLERKFKEAFKDTKKIKYYYGSMSEKDKKFDNIEEEWSDVDILIYTPIITCGINYDKEIPTFHSLYMWITPYSCVVRDLFQSSLRVRKLINNSCFFAFSYHYNTFSKKNVLINKLFTISEGDLEKIYINLVENQELITDLSPIFGTIPKLYDWGKRNLAFKIYEEHISNNQMVQLTHEYFRLCGYTIYHIENIEELKGIGTPQTQSALPPYIFIEHLTDFQYNLLTRLDICDLTEEQKYMVLKYKFNKYFHNIPTNIKEAEIINLGGGGKSIDNTEKPSYIQKAEIQFIWKEFYKNCNVLDNYYYDFNNISIHTQKILDETDKNRGEFNTFDCFINSNLLKKKYVDNIIKHLNKKDINELMHTGYTTGDIDNNLIKLTETIMGCKSLFNIRDKRGSHVGSYINSSIKYILNDYYGLKLYGKRKQINNKRVFEYTLSENFVGLYNLLEKYMTNNNTNENEKPKKCIIKVKKRNKNM